MRSSAVGTSQGFGVLTEIDVQATLRQKLDHRALARDLPACAADGAAPVAPDRRPSRPASDLPGGLAADSPHAVSKLAGLAAEPRGACACASCVNLAG